MISRLTWKNIAPADLTAKSGEQMSYGYEKHKKFGLWLV
jgi:hypothetical protein